MGTEDDGKRAMTAKTTNQTIFQTVVEPATPPLRALAWCFGVLIAGAPLAQLAVEKARGKKIQTLDYFAPLARERGEQSWPQFGKQLALDFASEPRLRRFEDDLRSASFITSDTLPWYQLGLTTLFHHGNHRVVGGNDGWLFFADDLASAYGRGYLEEGVGGQEALAAIDDFRDQLAERGIPLLLIPSFSKEMLDPEQLSTFTEGVRSTENRDLDRFYAELERRNHNFIRMRELFDACLAANGGAPLALPRDTHWSPPTMAFCAEKLAERARELLAEKAPAPDHSPRFKKTQLSIEGDGDLVRMLSLPAGHRVDPPMQLALEPIVDATTGTPVASDPKSDVLLMGDSLTKVFSDPSLGLGANAGLGEHLALHLDRALDVIALPGGSASATREALARREGGLDGKRLVIWQFGVRMLASGPREWRPVHLTKLGDAPDTTDVPTATVRLIGKVVETSDQPPEFDYAFSLGIVELEVEQVLEGTTDKIAEKGRVWVGFPIIVDGKDTPYRHLDLGTYLELLVDDLRLHFDLANTSFVDNTSAGRVLLFPKSAKPVK